MSKTKDLMAQLAAQRKAAVADDPHEQTESRNGSGGATAVAPEPALTPPQPPVKVDAGKRAAAPTRPAKKSNKKAATDPARKSERATLIFTPSALDALGTLQGFLLNDCACRSANASMAANIALEYAAENLKADKGRLKELFEARQQADGRRQKS